MKSPIQDISRFKPVEGCEQCEVDNEVCFECYMYGEAELKDEYKGTGDDS